MNVRRRGITLLTVTGTVALLLAGVAAASPMGGGMGGGTGTPMMQPTGTTMTQPGTGPVGNTTMMQPGTGPGGTTSTTMMQPARGPGQGHMFTDVASGDWFAQMAENMASHDFMGWLHRRQLRPRPTPHPRSVRRHHGPHDEHPTTDGDQLLGH